MARRAIRIERSHKRRQGFAISVRGGKYDEIPQNGPFK